MNISTVITMMIGTHFAGLKNMLLEFLTALMSFAISYELFKFAWKQITGSQYWGGSISDTFDNWRNYRPRYSNGVRIPKNDLMTEANYQKYGDKRKNY